MIPDGSAIIAIPKTDETMLTAFPISETGYISPYPIVVNAVVDQYTASKKDLKVLGSTLNIINADNIMYPIANKKTAVNISDLFRMTLTIKAKSSEYLSVLKSLRVLNTLKILKSLKVELIKVIDGKIDNRSIIANGVNG